MAVDCILAGAPWARGLVVQQPPWQRPALADTSLSLEFGFTSITGDTSGVALGAALAPVRRGPLRLGFAWEIIWVRSANGQRFGFGDPKVFARLRVLGDASTRAVFHLEGAGRIPVADPDLIPLDSGGQELELAATLGLGRARLVYCGAGMIWSEPASNSHQQSADVPHAVHLYGSLAHQAGDWVWRTRGDALLMEHGHERAEVEASVTRLAPHALHPTFVLGAGLGGADERVYDVLVALRFAMPLH